MDDKMKIKLLIDSVPYYMTISRKDEEIYRAAAKQLNNKLIKYRKNYQDIDSAKHLIMVAFELSFENLKEKGRNDTKPYIDRINVLDKLVDDCIKNGKKE